MDPRRGAAIVKALIAVIIWGASFVATKVALMEVSPSLLVWLRFGMGVLLLGVYAATRRVLTLPEKKDWTYLALLGFLGISLHQWLQSNGLVTSTATTTGWIVASMPIFMAILGWLVLKEKVTWLQVIGILVSAAGVLIIIFNGKLDRLWHGNLGARGDMLILLSAPNWAVFSVLSRRGLQKYQPLMMMFYVMLLGWLFTFIPLALDGNFGQINRIGWAGWSSILFLGIFCSGLAYIFWYEALRALSVTRTGSFLYLEPLVTAALAALILVENILAATLVGGVMVLFGVWLVNRKKENST